MKNNTLFLLCAALLGLALFVGQEKAAIAAPTGSTVIVRLQSPLSDRDTIVRKTDSTMSTSMIDAVDTDLFTEANLDTDLEENIARNVMGLWVITSHHDNADLICADVLDFRAASSGSDCDAKCAAAANWPGAALPTCDGSSTDASWILPGNRREYRVTGNQCLCYMAETATDKAQVERIAR